MLSIEVGEEESLLNFIVQFAAVLELAIFRFRERVFSPFSRRHRV